MPAPAKPTPKTSKALTTTTKTKGSKKASAESDKYTMTISRQTVDKLGVKMYDRVSAVVAELIANSYDADATVVKVSVPADQWLARKVQGSIVRELGMWIEIEDDGIGMDVKESNEFYLRVGSERRKDKRRGNVSRKFKRLVMGRKGVGKLAPFGICETIEVWTASDKSVTENGQQGYRMQNFTLELAKIMKDSSAQYHPTPGPDDGKLVAKHGTRIRLTDFGKRHVPSLEDLGRQMAQRFGIATANWKIELRDMLKPEVEAQQVGEFEIDLMPHTKITFAAPTGTSSRNEDGFKLEPACDYEGETIPGFKAGFTLDGKAYPISGWVAYAEQSYRDDLMAGIRIYCRGKIAAQTNLFDKKSGFTGEFSIRSYLVGSIEADWLDEEEDLIQTDRKDILWSEELGQQLEAWGQEVVKYLGGVTRKPIREKVYDTFKTKTNFEAQVASAFPSPKQKEIRDRALQLGEMFAQRMREEEAQDASAQDTVNLVMLLAPHVELDSQLRSAASVVNTQFAMVSRILKTARIAELSSFGRIADDRVKIINRLEELKSDLHVDERELQNLVDEAPWLIDPQWAPVTSNRALSTVRKRFEEYYNRKTGDSINLSSLDDAHPSKRPDFVLLEEDRALQIVEIKRPGYAFANADMERLSNYFEVMEGFMKDPLNELFLRSFDKTYSVTLVCDDTDLTGMSKLSYNNWIQLGLLKPMNWTAFLNRTRMVHQDFIVEAQRQQLFVSNSFVPLLPGEVDPTALPAQLTGAPSATLPAAGTAPVA